MAVATAADPSPERRPEGRRSDESGTVLMLIPAAVLIVFVLAAITVDHAIVFAGQRELVTTAQGAADDAAAVAFDVAAIRAGRHARLDPDRMGRAIRRAVALHDDDPDRPISMSWHLDGDEVVVELRREVPRVFTAAVPGVRRAPSVHARARARVLRTYPPS